MPNNMTAQQPDPWLRHDREESTTTSSPSSPSPPAQPQHLCLRFTSGYSTVEGILALAQEWARERGIPGDDGLSLRLVLDELLSNICMHAPPDTGVELCLELHNTALPAAGKDEKGPGTPPEGLAGGASADEGSALVRLTLTDRGPEFDPLSHCAPLPSSLHDSTPGGRGLTLVRLLTTAGQWQRKDGSNHLSLELPLGARERRHQQRNVPPRPAEHALSSRIRALWTENLALRQTVLFSFWAMICIWVTLGIYHATAKNQRQSSAEVLIFQALNTQSIISASFMQRVATGLETLAISLAVPTSNQTAVDPDVLLRQLWHGAALRPLTAEIPVLGVAAGYGGRTWLYRLEGGGIQRQEMEQDWSTMVSPPGVPYSWRSLFVTLQDNDPHAAMIYAIPLTASRKAEDGWIGAIITMPWIAKTLKGLGGFKNAEPFFCDSSGRYIVFPKGRQLGYGPQRLSEESTASPRLAMLEHNMLKGEKSLTQLRPVFGGDATPWPLPWQGPTSLAFMSLNIPGWYMGMLVSSEELGDAPLPLPPVFMLAALLGPLLMGCLTWLVTSRTLHPLHQLADALERLSQGDMNTPIPATRYADEVGVMLRTFERVRVTLKQSLHTLIYSTAAQQRLRNELALARRIQQSMLPNAFPQWPGARGHATVLMAQEVCGDLYDCFVTGDNKLCLVMGDVCGKGAPAAIIMSRTMTLARAFVLEGCSPAHTLHRLNTALLRRDTAHMFVTLLVGLLDADGCFTWAAAGHPPPLLGPERPVQTPGEKAQARSLDWSNELVLGVRQNERYTNRVQQLQKGQSLLLYTDGLEEARGVEGGDYGKKLEQAFTTVCLQGGSPEHMLEALLENHAQHRGSTALDDDISCLLVTHV